MTQKKNTIKKEFHKAIPNSNNDICSQNNPNLRSPFTIYIAKQMHVPSYLSKCKFNIHKQFSSL